MYRLNILDDIIILTSNYLSSRIVMTKYNNQTCHKSIKKGSPQGGAISPTLWNIVIDDFINQFNDFSNARILNLIMISH